MWLVSSMIISIIKFRFHVQSTAQLNYLLSTIVYVPDSKFTYSVTNALLYSQRISRDSPLQRLLPLRLPKMPYGYFACGLTQAVFEPHLFSTLP